MRPRAPTGPARASTATMPSQSLFLSYRREDSAGHTGRLHDKLAQRWGADRLFWDIDSIAPGEDFVEAIDRTLDQCRLVIVVIGPRWLDVVTEEGLRRIDDAADYHRQEILRAIERRIRLMPVLVGGARMPKPSALPAPLQTLARRHAFEITDKRFSYDTSQLIEAIERQLSLPPPEEAAPVVATAPAQASTGADWFRALCVLGAMGILVAAAFVAAVLQLGRQSDPVLAALQRIRVPLLITTGAARSPVFVASALQQETAAGILTVREDADRSVITIRGDALFAPNGATLLPERASAIAHLASALTQADGAISIVGHTDNVPVRTARFPSNWHLSADRARVVKRRLVEGGVPTHRISDEGRGDAEPVAANDTPAGRALNRRVEIRLTKSATAPSAEGAGK